MAEILHPHSKERLIDAARRAAATGCAIYHDGKRIFTAPARLNPGWHRVGIAIKEKKAA